MTRFVALGDSITLGIGDPVRLPPPAGQRGQGKRAWRGWAALLAASLPDADLHIVAGNGACMADLERDQLPMALQLRPDIASVVVGVNDTLRPGFDPGRIAASAAHTIGALRAAGADVLTMRLPDPGRMLGMPGVLARPLARRAREINEAMDGVAQRFGTLHFDAAGDSDVYDPRMWAVDRLHPSERGHRLIARRFHALLAQAGRRSARRQGPSRSASRRRRASSWHGWPPRGRPGLCGDRPTWSRACWPWPSPNGAAARPGSLAVRSRQQRLACGPLARRCHSELAFVGMTWQPELDELRRRQELAERMGGPDKIRRQHDAGRLTVRERIGGAARRGLVRRDRRAGRDSTRTTPSGELTSFMAANFVAGTGRIDGRKVVVGGDDFTIRGGAADAAIVGQADLRRAAGERAAAADRAAGRGHRRRRQREVAGAERRTPTCRSTRAGITSSTTSQSSRSWPPGSVLSPGWAPPGSARRTCRSWSRARRSCSWPDRRWSGAASARTSTRRQLGGSRIHARNGAVDLIAASEAAAFGLIRRFLSYLPPSAYALPPVIASADPVSRREEALLSAVPRDRRQPYRVREILRAVLRRGLAAWRSSGTAARSSRRWPGSTGIRSA